jgi:hypothetical protein
MKRSAKTSIALTSALFVSAWAHAQQPPDVVESDGNFNTAMGTGAMAQAPGDTFNNTAVGYHALLAGPGGGMCCGGNTAVGSYALSSDESGTSNTGVGTGVLNSNVTGNANTAIGDVALQFNTSGSNNTAAGIFALRYSTTGNDDTATGAYALQNNSTGSYNTAAGYESLITNSTGYRNEADGAWALQSNTSGHDNTASGQGALLSNTTGSYNIGLGANAGSNVTTGSETIEIGNAGNAADHNTIRIGTSGSHLTTFIAGIDNAKVTGSAVYVTSTGQLGVLASSERYKTAIASMGASTEKLEKLRPVSFHLKSDPEGAVQYGLIAEEVAQVYPELVIKDERGKIQGVRYEELASMLLNEVQKQASEIRKLKQQQKQFATRAEVASLKQELQAALHKLQSKEELVARR